MIRPLLSFLLLVGTCRCATLGDFFVRSIINDFDHVLNNSEPSQCISDLKALSRDFKVKKTWAVKMFDANGKPGSGVFSGNARQFGDYDECLAVEALEVNRYIRGKYCLTSIKPSQKHMKETKYLTNTRMFIEKLGINNSRLNRNTDVEQIPFSWGLCIPDSCSESEIQAVNDDTEAYFDLATHTIFQEAACVDNTKKPLPTKAIVSICVFALFGCLLIVSTAYDLISKKEKQNIWTAFSMYSNSKKIFTTKQPAENLGAINGIRVLSIMWVILGHAYMYAMMFLVTNILVIFEWSKKLTNVISEASPLAVDTFLTLSGFLVVYGYMTVRLNKKMDVPWRLFYLHRIIRLTPSLVAIVMLYSCLLSHLGEGPSWYLVEEFYEKPCNRYWWSTLLYIQNYYNSLDECANQSWYLAVDTQLYVLSPIILVLLLKKPKLAFSIIGTIFSMSTVAVYFITIKYNTGAIPADASDNYFHYLYHGTHIRCTPWLVGAVWGYYMQQNKDAKLTMSRTTSLFLWVLNLGVMITAMELHIILLWYDYNQYTAAAFNMFVRPFWAMGVCWIIFACSKGCGGFINSFLANPVFGVISKLCYSIYLVHLPVMIVISSQRRVPEYFSNLQVCFIFWAYFSLTLFVSVLWTLAFESPFIVMEKLLLGRPKSKKKFKITTIDVLVDAHKTESVGKNT